MTHYYDWKRGISPDPLWPDGPPYHQEGTEVLFNGKSVVHLFVFELMTGPNGWIRHQLFDKDIPGRPLTEIVDTVTGQVWLETDPDCPKYQRYVPGDPKPKLMEQTAVRTMYGEVTYAPIGRDGPAPELRTLDKDRNRPLQRTNVRTSSAAHREMGRAAEANSDGNGRPSGDGCNPHYVSDSG